MLRRRSQILQLFRDQRFIILLITVVLALIFASRSLLLCGFLATFLLLRPIKWKWIFAYIILFIVVISFFKTDSTVGRVFIYKNSVKLFSENFISGVGLNLFKKEYLLFQANVFQSDPSSHYTREAYLADNTIYAFNDYLQLCCEIGSIGLLFFLCLSYIVYHITQQTQVYTNLYIIRYCYIGLLFMAFFTPVFHNPFSVLFCYVLFFTLATYIVDTAKFRYFCCICCVLISLPIVKQTVDVENINKQTTAPVYLSRIGQPAVGNQEFSAMSEQGICNEKCQFHYAKNLTDLGLYAQAMEELNYLISHSSNSQYYSLIADCYKANGNFVVAEKNLLLAISMVPNRFEERYKLLTWYVENDMIAQAKVTAEIILKIKPKKNTDRVAYIKKSVENLNL